MSAPELKQSDNGFWYIHWSEDRRSKRESTRTKELAAAKRYFGEWLLLDHTANAAVGLSITCGELWLIYKKRHLDVNVSSVKTAGYAWANLSKAFGDRLPASITQNDVDAYVEDRREGRIGRRSKSGTIRRELVVLRAALNFCADPKRGVLQKEALPLFDLPADGAPRDRWLKPAEIDALFSAAEKARRGPHLSRVERFMWLALETGARQGAILDLTWDRCDFETGVVHFTDPDRQTTKKRRASVPISARLRPVLERAFRERDNNLVMTNKGAIWASIQRVATAAGFGSAKPPKGEKPPKGASPPGTGISPHVFRHTAATNMARSGVSLFKIAKVLGNSVDVVERVYAKHCPADLVDAVDTISSRAALGTSAQIERDLVDHNRHYGQNGDDDIFF